MATGTPLSPGALKQDFKLPMPPPLLHTRSGNSYDRPSTPTVNTFTSPISTPQGSPSKSKLPPGAKELPNVFENAMRLEPASPTKYGQQQLTVGSPNKTGRGIDEDDSVSQPELAFSPGNPNKKSNKENTPPIGRSAKEIAAAPTHAALSRHEQYHARDSTEVSSRTRRLNPARALSAEDLEKLQLPKVKRLANVTQIYFLDYYFDLLNYIHQRELRQAHFDTTYPAPNPAKIDRVPATSAKEYDSANAISPTDGGHTTAASDPPTVAYNGAKAKYLGKERALLRKRRTRLRHGDFQILTQVGQGGYGQVFLASKKDTKEVCALKVMSKKLLFKLDEIRHILTERDILTAAKSEWLVKLLYAFQDESSIYLAMEYVPGGDFRTLLNNTGVLPNRYARFYISEMFSCVDALHQLGYIHRDLKPENFLIDATGHVKLTDFGLAAGMLSPLKIESMRIKLEEVGNMSVPFGRPMEGRSMAERREDYRSLRGRELNYAKSIVGSPDYMAPEVLKGENYDFTVDYWSLGCMLFESIAGYPPFSGATVDETWHNLRHWKEVFQKPEWDDPQYFLSSRTWDLICRLVNSKDRRFSGITEIHRHQYFAEVDFNKLREQKPPFVPDLDSEVDAGYFDDFSSAEDMAKYKEVHDKQMALESMADRDEKMNNQLFVGFTFRHRKTAGDAEGGRSSPRKALATDGMFGTIF